MSSIYSDPIHFEVPFFLSFFFSVGWWRDVFQWTIPIVSSQVSSALMGHGFQLQDITHGKIEHDPWIYVDLHGFSQLSHGGSFHSFLLTYTRPGNQPAFVAGWFWKPGLSPGQTRPSWLAMAWGENPFHNWYHGFGVYQSLGFVGDQRARWLVIPRYVDVTNMENHHVYPFLIGHFQ